MRRRRNFVLLLCAAAIGVGTLLYTNYLIRKLSAEEHKKIAQWAAAYQMIMDAEIGDSNLDFYMQIVYDNTTIPFIWTDADMKIIDSGNMDSTAVKRPDYLHKRLERMKDKHQPITIHFDGQTQYIYYDDSSLIYQLSYYPFVQLGIIILFVAVAYFAFSSSRRAEQNKVWVGLSKETAHQLGTPISSLLAITELLKPYVSNDALLLELEKDVARLNSIAERFSKIGSKPALPLTDVTAAIASNLNYVRQRAAGKVEIIFEAPVEPLFAPLNEQLFSWVIENLCKNALDAMNGTGSITLALSDGKEGLNLDVTDTGKGIPKSRHKTIFKPGFTTKSRGWGLGLSLSKRIIEDYHHGRIYVLRSEPDHGTTFRITLRK